MRKIVFVLSVVALLCGKCVIAASHEKKRRVVKRMYRCFSDGRKRADILKQLSPELFGAYSAALDEQTVANIKKKKAEGVGLNEFEEKVLNIQEIKTKRDIIPRPLTIAWIQKISDPDVWQIAFQMIMYGRRSQHGMRCREGDMRCAQRTEEDKQAWRKNRDELVSALVAQAENIKGLSAETKNNVMARYEERKKRWEEKRGQMRQGTPGGRKRWGGYRKKHHHIYTSKITPGQPKRSRRRRR